MFACMQILLSLLQFHECAAGPGSAVPFCQAVAWLPLMQAGSAFAH